MMENCKLFDLAAFGSDKAGWQVPEELGTTKHQGHWRATGRILRQAVLLDCSTLLDVFVDWFMRIDPSALEKEFNQVVSPWASVFVFAGKQRSDKGQEIEVGCLVDSFPGTVDQEHFYMSIMVFFKSLGRSRIGCSSPLFLHFNDLRDCTKLSTIEFREPQEGDCEGAQYMKFFPLFCFHLMHCRNVITEEHDPYRPQMPKGKRNKSPKITYHTLSISNTLVKCEGGEATGDGCEKAKHLCRGNFAHYTKEKPLFGKYVGMFWRPMHVKGNAKHGIAGKDYELIGNRSNG